MFIFTVRAAFDLMSPNQITELNHDLKERNWLFYEVLEA